MHLFIQLTTYGFYKFLKFPNQRTFLKLALLYGGKKRYKPGKIKFNGFNFFVPDYRSFLWQYKEIFVDEYYKFKTDNKHPVIYDCGANVGTSCVYFKKLYPESKIKAFEVDPNIVEVLKTNLKKNNIGGVEVINKAVWINDNGVDISFEGADASSIFLEGEKQKVESVRLKEMIESEDEIEMLKMDIEGAEYDVIMDCDDSLKRVKNIFIEYHSYSKSEQRLSKILDVLERNNFKYFIKNDNDRSSPFVNKINKFNPALELQLNIFGYRE